MADTSAAVILKSGRDKSVRNRHPRLFSGAIKAITGTPRDGDIVDVLDNKNVWLARGALNRLSSIAVRLLTWDQSERVDDAFFAARVRQAIMRRDTDPSLRRTNARRIIFAEADGLPGLIVDDYAGHLVAEFSAHSAIQARDAILNALRATPGVQRVIERYDDERLKAEFGNNSRLVQTLKRNQDIEPALVEISENGLRFQVNLAGGQKTGFYLDQRDNRARVAAYCAGASVLNAFAYSGSFALYALRAGATQAINVDSSRDALALAETNAALNGLRATQVCADAFDDLHARAARGERFDVIVLDPPKMAHHPGQIDKAARAYKDANRLGLTLLKPGGTLATFSCSGVVSAELLQQIVFSAALEAGRETRIVERLSQASDHPVLTTYPESAYLKGFILNVA